MDKLFIDRFINQYHLDVLFIPNPAFGAYFDVYLSYLVICIPLAIIMVYFIPERFEKSNLYMSLLFVIFSVFIPVIGPIIILIGIFLLRLYALNYSMVKIIAGVQKQFGSEKISKLTPHASGWAHMRIFNKSFSKDERVRALYAINKQHTKQVNDLNRALFTDNSDEIRLYAFNVLNTQQSLITDYVKKYLDMKNEVKEVSELAQIHKALAYLCWEYVALDLNPGHIAGEMLIKSHLYANEALKDLPGDGGLWLLLATVSNLLKRYDESHHALEMANNLMQLPSSTFLTLASRSFVEKDYAQVRSYLQNNIDILDISPNATITKFWCKHE